MDFTDPELQGSLQNIVQKEILDGLNDPVKHLPCKLLYDERGSELFEKICTLEEYYPTRTEISIMHGAMDQIVECIGDHCLLLELGSGSSSKTRLLLDRLPDLGAYMPIDISKEILHHSTDLLSREYPHLCIEPLCADFSEPFAFPTCLESFFKKTVVYFPGSTIGNFEPSHAIALLKKIASWCGEHGALLIGVDLKKDPQMLWRAYNDSKGITAAFNRNLLTRLNREFNADFNVEHFRHCAPYYERENRVEMHLVSTTPQYVTVGTQKVSFKEGESILTEFSYKFTIKGFGVLAQKAGLIQQRVWTDSKNLFSVQYLTCV